MGFSVSGQELWFKIFVSNLSLTQNNKRATFLSSPKNIDEPNWCNLWKRLEIQAREETFLR